MKNNKTVLSISVFNALLALSFGTLALIVAPGVSFAAPVTIKDLGNPPTICTEGVCCGLNYVCTGTPYLIETVAGTETISTPFIKVGQEFTITYSTSNSPSQGPFSWTFPDIAEKVSSCVDSVDTQCTYKARTKDVTYPQYSDYNGWSKFNYTAGYNQGAGSGWGYYAIIGSGADVSGTITDKGHPLDLSILFTKPGKKVPSYYGGIADIPHSSTAHPNGGYGYYGVLIKPGTYSVTTYGVGLSAKKCKPYNQVITFPAGPKTLNITCKYPFFN